MNDATNPNEPLEPLDPHGPEAALRAALHSRVDAAGPEASPAAAWAAIDAARSDGRAGRSIRPHLPLLAAAAAVVLVVAIGGVALFANRGTDVIVTPATDPTASVPATGPDAVPAAIELRVDGLGPVSFGDDAEEALAALADRLGPPTEDFGWSVNRGPFPGPAQLRYVTWQDLGVAFTDDGAGRRRVAGWTYSRWADGDPDGTTPPRDPAAAQPAVTLPYGLALGQTPEEVLTRLPGAAKTGTEGASGYCATTDPATGDGMCAHFDPPWQDANDTPPAGVRVAAFDAGWPYHRADLQTSGTSVPSTSATDPTTSLVIGTLYRTRTDVVRRQSPTSQSDNLGVFAQGIEVRVVCQVTGEFVSDPVAGGFGTDDGSDVWNRLDDGTYVADWFVETPKKVEEGEHIPRYVIEPTVGACSPA